ncbi:dipeptide/oligopeptide/nickel ABC transporter permease/ATP-binding protein [Alloyangia pacifica]|uniref:dipeptide/oligopeptide/nickel ABC transporter permease/ATP-binding protein n=1 Tax=Alloyangia pacifica TaxID=311180 RepID=UPI001CD6590B|nr:dipeptide/oligopeptide/nickel ABC transporter permease/ATP-binding protein [Alloyangia pacifica]MCA0997219.1 dipeptide/oligopeptide/nickel ABC transporter permease/ATP-binding protein [Alloyangia pacifica]
MTMTSTTDDIPGGAETGARQGLLRQTLLHPRLKTLRRIASSPKGAIGLALVTVLTFLAFFGPWLAPLDPYKQDFMATLQPPSAAHWFGTDQLGRDVFSRILVGARSSLGIGVGGVAVAFVIGVPLGLAAAYVRGTFDQLLMRGVDIMLSFPDIVFALAVVAILGPSTWNVILAVGIVSIPVFIRTTRAVAMSTLSEPFVEGSVSLGCSPLRVMARHVLPNMGGILVTLCSLLFASTLLNASGLSFLGLGTQPPEPEWGTMLGESRSYIRSHPYMATFPGLFLALSALGFNLLGEELRNIYDPTAAKRRKGQGMLARLISGGKALPAAPRETAAEAKARLGVASDAAALGRDLEISYLTERGQLPAVRGVDFALRRGRTLAVVGESGSGKSTLLRAVGTLLPRGQAVVSGGELEIAGKSAAHLSGKEVQDLRRRHIGMVFQDAASALNPVMTIGAQLAEALTSGTSLSAAEVRARSIELLKAVQIADPESRLSAYPHQFSGGMKQRIVIAIALAQEPEILLADEPTSALDVTIQQQILTLLRKMQKERDMAMMLVTHDLGLVARYADDVAVIYAGRIVEVGPVDEVFRNARHPYTRALRNSTPKLRHDGSTRLLPAISGEPPMLGRLPEGCSFAPRCARAQGRAPCMTIAPDLQSCGVASVACHFAQEEEA